MLDTALRARLALGFLLTLAIAASAQTPPRSTTGPVPPPGYKPPAPDAAKAATTIPGVPAYAWRHGCGPTAVGMVIGYYDRQGFDDLIPGEHTYQSPAVNHMIASGGTASNPNPPGAEEHYEDYAMPEDDDETGLIA
ncbi:MAG TPA: hypothetical protein ENN42_10380, partial [Thioalkalivibrio sp.]|nr:hypothetical protein [Thioalkalivibrio sp.]